MGALSAIKIEKDEKNECPLPVFGFRPPKFKASILVNKSRKRFSPLKDDKKVILSPHRMTKGCMENIKGGKKVTEFRLNECNEGNNSCAVGSKRKVKGLGDLMGLGNVKIGNE